MGLIIGGAIGAVVGGGVFTAAAATGATVGAAIGGAATSIATSLYSGYQQQQQMRAQGEAQQAMANYNSQVDENTAIAANQTAKMEKKAASEQSERQRRENKRLKAAQAAAQMKTGGTASSSALLVEEDQLAEMKLQELDILHQGELRAREHRLQGMQASASAVGSRFQGVQAREMGGYRSKSLLNQGYMSAVGQGVQGVSNTFSSGFSIYQKSPQSSSGFKVKENNNA